MSPLKDLLQPSLKSYDQSVGRSFDGMGFLIHVKLLPGARGDGIEQFIGSEVFKFHGELIVSPYLPVKIPTGVGRILDELKRLRLIAKSNRSAPMGEKILRFGKIRDALEMKHAVGQMRVTANLDALDVSNGDAMSHGENTGVGMDGTP